MAPVRTPRSVPFPLGRGAESTWGCLRVVVELGVHGHAHHVSLDARGRDLVHTGGDASGGLPVVRIEGADVDQRRSAQHDAFALWILELVSMDAQRRQTTAAACTALVGSTDASGAARSANTRHCSGGGAVSH